MAVSRKINTDAAAHKVKDTVTTQDGSTTTVETWHGGYAQLQAKQAAVKGSATATSLTPQGPTAELTVTYTVPSASTADFAGSEVIVEVMWQELRQPIELHPMFADATLEEISEAKKAVASSEESVASAQGRLSSTGFKLYSFLRKGHTEFSQGVPVVRRTTTKRSGKIGSGTVWKRSTPPAKPAGEWEYLKTADDRRKDGRTYSQVEEWTGAHKWDKEIYP